MAKDTRTSQIQTGQLVISSSQALLVYPVEKQDSANPNQGIVDSSKFPTGSIGQDVLLFVSGAVGGKGGSARVISAFGGDLHISGNLVVDGTAFIQEENEYFYPVTFEVVGSSGSLFLSGALKAAEGLSGSLTTLADGTPYLIAGENVQLTTGANGAITIQGSPGFFTSPSAGLAVSSGSLQLSGALLVKSGITGALNVLPDGQPFLKAGPAIVLSTGSNGQITIEALTGSVGAPGATNEIAFNDGLNVLTASNTFWVNPGVSLNVSGVVKASGGFSGSLTTLVDGTPYITTVGGVSIVTGANGSLQLSGTQGISEHSALSGLSNDDHTQYLLTDGSRTLTGNQSFGGFNITNVGDLKATSLTGSLTRVAAGVPFLQVTGGLSVTTQSNGSLLLSGTSGISDHGALDGLGDDDHTQYLRADGTRALAGGWSLGLQNVISGGLVKSQRLSGSLTKLYDGSDYLVGGTAITLTTGANGSITIAATPGATLAAGGENEIQFNKSNALSASNNLWIQNGEKLWVTGAVQASLGFTGSLTRTVAGTPAFDTSNGLSISTGSNGQVVISGNPMSASIAEEINQLQSDVASAGFGLWFSNTNNLIENTGSFAVSGSGTVKGALTVQSGITGALNFVASGVPFLVSAGGLVLSTGSNGQVTVSTTALSSSIATDVISLRNRTFFHSITANLAATTGSVAASGSLLIKSGITGALNKLPDGQNFLIGSNGLSTSTGSNGQITVSGNPLSSSVATDVNAIRSNIASGIIWQSTTNGLAFTTGSLQATGSLLVKSGITGALNRLPDGTNFLVGSNGLSTSTGSSGQITVSGNPLSSSVAADVNELRGIVGGTNAWSFYNGAVNTTSSVGITASLIVKSGITGALNKLPDGTDFLRGSNGVTTTTGSSGFVTVSFNEQFFYGSVRNFSGTELFLANTDNNSLIYVSNSSDVIVHAPSTLNNGFQTGLIQKASGRMVFRASGSLLYPADFTATSSQTNSLVGLFVSGTNKDVHLAGDLQLGSLDSLSASVAADITNLRYPVNVVDSSGDRTLTEADNTRVIFMSGASANRVRVPTGLTNGFNVTLVQASATKIQVLATASLKYPSTTFKSGSAEENSMLAIYSGSAGLFLGGDMELA